MIFFVISHKFELDPLISAVFVHRTSPIKLTSCEVFEGFIIIYLIKIVMFQ